MSDPVAHVVISVCWIEDQRAGLGVAPLADHGGGKG